MGRRHLAAGTSLFLVLASLVLLAVSGLNFGLDFTGGTLVELRFQSAAPVDAVRIELADNGSTPEAIMTC